MTERDFSYLREAQPSRLIQECKIFKISKELKRLSKDVIHKINSLSKKNMKQIPSLTKKIEKWKT